MSRQRPPSHRSVRLQLPARRSLRIGVVADTHSRPHPKTVELLGAQRVDAILHAGDIGDMGVLDELEACAPLTAVRGNIDGRSEEIPDSVDVTIGDRDSHVARLLLMHIAVRGPRLRADAARLAQRYSASVVVCGHSHVPFIGQDRGLTIFNPGSIGPRRFTLPITFGLLEISATKMNASHISCETGERWLPPALP